MNSERNIGMGEKLSEPASLDELFDLVKKDTLTAKQNEFQATRKYTPIIRGVRYETETSLQDLLQHTPIYHWWRLDKQSFLKAATRDYDLGHAMQAITELLDLYHVPQGNIDGSYNLLPAAITEKAYEVSILAAPYMPMSIKNKLYGKKDKEEIVQEEVIVPIFSEDKIQKIPKPNILMIKLMRWLNGLKIRGQALPSISGGSGLELPDLSIDLNINLNWKTDGNSGMKRKINFSKNTFLHPLLSEDGRVGRERFMKYLPNYSMGEYAPETMRYLENAFIVTKVYNSYDAERGILKAEAERLPYTRQGRKTRKDISRVSAPLGRVDAITRKAVAIPWPVEGTNNVRYGVPYTPYYLNSIDLDVQGEKTIAGEELKKYLEYDALGNYYLSFSNLPDELTSRIHGRNIILDAWYEQNYSNIAHPAEYDTEWIGKMPEDEEYRLNLYPREIANFIQTLRKKKQEGKVGFQDNQEIFTRLAKFIGNFWMSYDLLDAPSNENDPVGFNQTERAFARAKASCEGSNIALGQLMRYFLEDDEGVAYVEGYVIESSGRKAGVGVATTDDFHVKVIYKESTGKRHFYDATPWPQQLHEQFVREVDQYHDAKREWFDQLSQARTDISTSPRQEKELEKQALQAEERLKNSWYGDVDVNKPELRQLFTKKRIENIRLPGLYESASVHNLISQFVAAQLRVPIHDRSGWMARLFGSPTHLQSVNIYSQNLGNFLKDIYQVDNDMKYFWEAGEPTSINGQTNFELGFLHDPMYHPSENLSMGLPTDFDRGDRKRILISDQLRTSTYTDMVRVYKAGQIASLQNTAVINTLSERIEDLSKEYQEKFKHTLSWYEDKLPVDVHTFFQSAPFILLLENPLKKLSGSVTRETEGARLGFLKARDSEEDMVEDMDRVSQSLYDWRLAADQTLINIDALLDKAPLRTRYLPQEVQVSSQLLWENHWNPALSKKKDRRKQYLEPTSTFSYLYYKLYDKRKMRRNRK